MTAPRRTMPRWLQFDPILALVLVIVAVGAPFLVKPFALFKLAEVACYGIGVLGLKLLTGYNGQFSLGHSFFYAAGAYFTAILVPETGFAIAAIAGTAFAFALGLLVGWPALRIKGHHLGLITFVLGLAAPQIIRSSLVSDWTGGSRGLSVTVPGPIAGLGHDLGWYVIAVAVAAAVAIAASVLTRGPFGRAMQASRDNPIAARAIGINTALVDTLTFGISAACAGLGGAMLAGILGYLGASSVEFTLAIGLFVGVAVTGTRSIPAAFLGGALIVYLPTWTDTLSNNFSWAIYGVTLLVLLYIQVAAPGLIKRVGERSGIVGERQ